MNNNKIKLTLDVDLINSNDERLAAAYKRYVAAAAELKSAVFAADFIHIDCAADVKTEDAE